MRAAVFQSETTDALTTLDAAAHRAAAAGAALLVLPELFLTGYNIGADALRARAEPACGPGALAAAQIAARHRIALLYGYPERDGASIYNAALLLGPDGRTLANMRKLHLFGDMERAVFTPGRDPCVLATIGGLRVGVLICYDVEFPEAVRALALRGADLVAVPTAQMQPYAFVPRVLVRARAYENQVFLIYANRCGREGELIYTGESCIIGADGGELARAGLGEELITADFDAADLARARGLNTFLRDRLPHHYAEPQA